MLVFAKKIKKSDKYRVAVFIASLFTCSLSYAQNTSSDYLREIRDYTYGTLEKVNDLPAYLSTLSEMAISWMSEDDSATTAQLQQDFASLGSLFVQDIATQNSYIPKLNADLFGQSESSFTFPPDKPAILDVFPTNLININDLTYSILLGTPASTKAPSKDSPYNYVKYASGLKINHVIPGNNWRGSKQDQLTYLNYYGTVLSVESFNGYVLSGQLAESNTLTTLQSTLISQASNSSWIAEISTEELGKVLRQLLMFESQTYVLISQLLQTQRQLLNAQVMTNSLLILNNHSNESYLVSKAQGVQATP